MNKRMILIGVGLFVAVGLFFSVKSIRYEHYPVPKGPSTEWEPYIRTLDIQRETYFIDANGTKLEAELFIPNGGNDQKPAVIFSPGSGDSLYQNYDFGLVETYVVDVFLPHDFAVLLVNKRRMGQSEGNYVKNSIQGRAEDIWTAVQSIQNHPQIDAQNVGLIGHSQGGWVVSLVAAEHPEIAFYISLAGPTTSMRENAADNYVHFGQCQGLEAEELDAYIGKRMKMVDLSISIGKITDFGFFGFDARNMAYDPREAIQTVRSPGLFVYAENDDQVSPSLNIDRLNEIFDNKVLEHLNVVVIDNASHAFCHVNGPCESWVNVEDQEQSAQLIAVLNDWLREEGY